MESWVVATGLIFLYLVATIVIGVAANRRMSVDMEDFLLVGRKAGVVVLYLTVVASFHSAFAFLGSGGFFYTHGVGFWAAGTWTLLVGAITYVVGTRIWALGKAFGYITPADMLADYYESEAVRVVVAVISVVFTILYIQVQAQGLGYIINVASGGRISFELGTLVLLVVAAGYLMAGGLRAVYWTDVIQGVWMYVAVWGGALFLAYELFGGPLELWRTVAAERPDLLTLPGPTGFFTPGDVDRDDDHALVRGRLPAAHAHPLLHGGGRQDAQDSRGHDADLPDDALHSGGARRPRWGGGDARLGRARGRPDLPGAALRVRAPRG